MSKCKYIINEENGDFILEIPSSLSSADPYDLEQSFLSYLAKEEIDPDVLLDSLKKIEKTLVIPEQIKNYVIGQNSLRNVYRNIKDVDLKNRFIHLNNILLNNWNSNKKSGKNPTSKQNIVFCAFDENTSYEYNKDLDIILVNTINGINNEDILKASIERSARLLGVTGDIRQLLKNQDQSLFEKLNISNISPITPNDISLLYFNDNSIKRESIVDNIGEKRESFLTIREKYENLASQDNRDFNYEPVNEEFVYELNPGDMVQISSNKEIQTTNIKEKTSGYYSLLVDYSVNSDGKYVIKTISPNSNYPETTILDSNLIMARKQSLDNKFSDYSIKEGEYIPIKLPTNLYFNNKFLYKNIKRGDKITMGRTDYTVLNVKGSLFYVQNNKGEFFEIKPTNKINLVKLNSEQHKNLLFKEEDLKDFTKSPILSLTDREYILDNDVVKYGENLGLVVTTIGSNLYVKNLKTSDIEEISKVNVSEHYINNVGNKSLINSLNENSQKIINTNPNIYGDYLDSDYNWVPFYKGMKLRRGDFIVKDGKSFVIIDEHNGAYRVNSGSTYLFINQDNLSGFLIATTRKQDPKLAKTSINKNSYYISDNPNHYDGNYQSYPVKIILNTNTGETKVIPESQEMKSHYVDKTDEVKKEKNIDLSKQIYSFKRNGGLVVKNSEQTIPIINANENFQEIYNFLIPGTFIKFGFDSKDLKYWLIEKQIGDKYLISHSYYRNNEIKTVKRLLSSLDTVSEVRLPKYASSVLEKINNKIGIKQSKEISSLNDTDSVETLIAMSSFLEHKFGINFNFISDSEANSTDKAYVLNGEYFINSDRASIEEPLHELLHVVLASMKYSNPEQYRKLVESVEDHPLFKQVSSNYQETNLDRLEETFIRLFTQSVRHEINIEGVFSEKSFEDSVKTAINNMFALQMDTSEEFSYNLLDSSVKDILLNFGSSLIENSDSLYNKDNAIEMMKVSSTLRQLIKEGNLKEKCNG